MNQNRRRDPITPEAEAERSAREHRSPSDDGQGSLPLDSGSLQSTANTDTSLKQVEDGADSTAPQRRAPEMNGPTRSADDPFDPARLRLSQDFHAATNVKKVLTTVPVDKPKAEWWVRAHPDPAYRLQTAVIELKEDQEVYLVDRSLWAELASEPAFGPRLFVTAINRQNVLFLWMLRLPGPDGKANPWHQSALEAAERATTAWVRISANQALGAYDVAVAPAQHSEPAWPEWSFTEILKVAFRDRMIDSLDHPVLRRLRGEV